VFKSILLSSVFISTLSLHGADRVKVDVSSKMENKQLSVQFKVTSQHPLKLNFEAPWHLKLGDAKIFKKTNYTAADFSKELPGFVLLTKELSKASSLPYELTAFSCTTDGLQCFREVLKGEYKIKTTVNKK